MAELIRGYPWQQKSGKRTHCQLNERCKALENDHATATEVQRYQQFIMRVQDDRGRPVSDYDLSFHVWDKNKLKELNVEPQFGKPLFPKGSLDASRNAASDTTELSGYLDAMLRSGVHRHGKEHNYRRFLLNVDEIATMMRDEHVLTFTLVATTGDENVRYATEHVNDVVVHPQQNPDSPSLFFPDTTTQIDVTLDRYSVKGNCSGHQERRRRPLKRKRVSNIVEHPLQLSGGERSYDSFCRIFFSLIPRR